MTLQTAGPGKTAPKLYKDFLAFDPKAAKPNVLIDRVPAQGEGPQPAPHHTSCKHDYATKSSQSSLPSLDLRSDGSARYKLAVVCKRCRIHADIRVDNSVSSSPCPSSHSPVHHFRPAREHIAPTSSRIRYDWQCSVEDCCARLSITYRLPRTRDEDRELLTNQERLKSRYDELLKADPTREGLRVATDMDALSRLRKYIRDALDPKHTKRQFPANNKRFQEAFGLYGQDCRELFESFGFKYAVSSDVEGGEADWDSCDRQDSIWILPSPEQVPDQWLADGDSQRELLEDVEMELWGMMFKLAAETGAVMPTPEIWPSADRDIERTLGAQGYQRYAALRRPSNEELPFFNSLGALPDFADSLIEFSYDRQIISDTERASYYFECLQVITAGRNSEQLQMKVAMLESQNTVSRRDVNAAFSAFNILLKDKSNISDQEIINRFQALLGDQAPAAQQRSREHLFKIGAYRNSNFLINASRQSVDTYEDALTWLGNGVTKDTPDESLIAVFQLKIDGNQDDEEIGKSAMSTIAKARKSDFLNNWLLTGRQDSNTMTVDEALRHLNIDQKLEELEQTILPAIFDSARQDRPGDVTEKAITTIQDALRGGAGGTGAGGLSGAQHAPATWPVGLRSHGNTCYLNSLLQYYFSIQPLRDIILEYEKYQLDTAKEPQKAERVGHANVTSVEIKGGQRFAQDLRHLFGRMIREHGATVRPEDDLVCRAFLDPKNYHLMGAAANTDDIPKDAQASMANGVIEEEPKDVTDTDTIMHQPDSKDESTSSSQTLNGDAEASMAQEGKVLTPPASPDLEARDQKPQPEHKPPLPPRINLRRFSTTVRVEALEMAKQNARDQQDVTEVHDSAMWRLRSGMTPQGQDSSGEQEDPLRNLFSIGYLDTKVKDGTSQKPEVRYDTSIVCDVPKEDTDIYSSLDKWFDLSPPNQEDLSIESYKSIKALPPILQVATPRIDFDKDTLQAFKSTKMVRLEEEIYLDRYTDHSHPSTLAKRKMCWSWKRQLKDLKAERSRLTDTGLDIDSPTVFSNAAQFFAGLDEVNQTLESIGDSPIEADGDITSALTTMAQEQAARLTTLDSEIDDLQSKIAAQFKDMKNIKYRLAAVFFHRGSTGSGHYWIYIHDFRNKMWRKYNDETIEEQTKLDDILAANSYQQGTPTYVVYVAEDKLDFVQPVCRDPEEAPAQEDVQMGGTGWGTQDTTQWNTTEPQPAKPRSQMEALDPQLLDSKMVDDGGEAAWEDKDRQVADAKWKNDSPCSTAAVVDLDAIAQDLSIGRVSPSKRHRRVSDDVEAKGSVSSKHRRTREKVDEVIGNIIAAKATVAFTDEQLARAFERDL